MKFVHLHTKVQNYYKKLIPALRLATLVTSTRRDEQLCDEAQGMQLCQTCWSNEPESNLLSYDTALYDLTLQDAVIVLPTHESFFDPLKDVLPPTTP
jgi:hypothetical protein